MNQEGTDAKLHQLPREQIPQISVLMPVYNCGRYLDEAIWSIRRQTFTNFEFVIVNDGSTDDSLEIILRHAAADSRIVLVEQANGGIVSALNAGLHVCSADLIARMDGDDVAEANRLEKQVQHLDAHQDLVLVGCGVRWMDGQGRPFNESPGGSEHQEILAALLRGHMAVVHPSWMFRKSVVESLGGYSSEFEHVEDFELLLRISEVGAIARVGPTLMNYRMHAASITSRKHDLQRARAYEALLRAYRRRNIEWCEPSFGAARPQDRFHYSLFVAHQALEHDFTSTARAYALQMMGNWPHRRASWRLLARCILGPRAAAAFRRWHGA